MKTLNFPESDDACLATHSGTLLPSISSCAHRTPRSRAARSERVELHAAVVSELDDGVLAELLDERVVRELRALARRVADAAVRARRLACIPALREVVECDLDPLHHALHAARHLRQHSTEAS